MIVINCWSSQTQDEKQKSQPKHTIAEVVEYFRSFFSFLPTRLATVKVMRPIVSSCFSVGHVVFTLAVTSVFTPLPHLGVTLSPLSVAGLALINASHLLIFSYLPTLSSYLGT